MKKTHDWPQILAEINEALASGISVTKAIKAAGVTNGQYYTQRKAHEPSLSSVKQQPEIKIYGNDDIETPRKYTRKSPVSGGNKCMVIITTAADLKSIMNEIF